MVVYATSPWMTQWVRLFLNTTFTTQVEFLISKGEQSKNWLRPSEDAVHGQTWVVMANTQAINVTVCHDWLEKYILKHLKRRPL